MSEPIAAERLRRRAIVLRTLAARIDHLRVLSLHVAAGPETWVGPSPHACEEGLRSRALALRGAVDGLRAEARRFDRIADDMVTSALAGGPR